MDLWTELLALLSQVVTPIWNELIQYIPLLLFGLVPLVLLLTFGAWHRNKPRNASRVPARLPDGKAPEGLHLPSPSRWPLVGALGGFFIFASLIFGQTTQIPARDASGQVVAGQMTTVSAGPDLVLLSIGLVIGALAFIGWFLDARKEYEVTVAGDHHLVLAAETAGRPVVQTIPEGVHLPPPSPWPFFAPVGIFFAFLGLALGPVLIVGGLAMAGIAAVGWTLEARREYREVADGEHMDPELRDPERVWPKRLVPVYAGIAVLSITLSLGNWMLSFLPQTEDAVAGGGPTATTEPYISASTVIAFEVTEVVVPADTPFTITFENKQVGVDHNVEIFADAAKTQVLYDGEVFPGPATKEYEVQPLAAGTYPYICKVHPVTMVGNLIVE